MRLLALALCLSVSPLVAEELPVFVSPPAETALPTLAPTPEMSRYGWVGTWNWTLETKGSSDGVARRTLWDYRNYNNFYTPTQIIRQHYEDQEESDLSWAIRLRAEKVLTSSYASRLELDYGTTHVSGRSSYAEYNESSPPSVLAYGPYTSDESYRAHLLTLSWGHSANSTGAWMPPDGWTGTWGPNGRAWRPSIDAKLSLFMELEAPHDYYFYSSTYGVGFNLGARIQLAAALPLFNGGSVGVGYAAPLRQGLFFSGGGVDSTVMERLSFDSELSTAALSFGIELAVPQRSPLDPSKEANPDGRLYQPHLGIHWKSFGDTYQYASSVEYTLKVPVTPRSSLVLSAERLDHTDTPVPTLQRYRLAWQLYAAKPTVAP